MSPDPRRRRAHLEAARALRSLGIERPKVALILGSGLGGFAREISRPLTVPVTKIPGYPRSTVEGHAGRLVFGRINEGRRSSPPLLIFQGRVHFYETGDVGLTVAPVELAAALGVRTLFITNSAGGINRSFSAGDLMVLRDVISLLPPSFPRAKSGLTKHRRSPFDKALTERLLEAGQREGLELQEGTYCWARGPSYETAAEIRMLGVIGADAVGMSTVPEVWTALDRGMRVAGVSLISNLGTGLQSARLSHAEVTETGRQASARFTRLIRSFLLNLPS